MPKPNNDDIIIPVTQVMEDFRNYFGEDNRMAQYRDKYVTGAYNVFTNFQKDVSKTVNSLQFSITGG